MRIYYIIKKNIIQFLLKTRSGREKWTKRILTGLQIFLILNNEIHSDIPYIIGRTFDIKNSTIKRNA